MAPHGGLLKGERMGKPRIPRRLLSLILAQAIVRKQRRIDRERFVKKLAGPAAVYNAAFAGRVKKITAGKPSLDKRNAAIHAEINRFAVLHAMRAGEIFGQKKREAIQSHSLDFLRSLHLQAEASQRGDDAAKARALEFTESSYAEVEKILGSEVAPDFLIRAMLNVRHLSNLANEATSSE